MKRFMLIALLLSSGLAGATEPNCELPGRFTPAVPVPECVSSTGEAVACSDPAGIRLWPDNFSPASSVPERRDSTARVAGQFVPGWFTGFELFSGVDIVTEGGVGRRLYVAYNAGLQVWDIDGAKAADPVRLDFRDGWEGMFLQFPPVTEVLVHIEDVAAVPTEADGDLVALSGKPAVGPTLWRFDGVDLLPLYQGRTFDARQVRIFSHGGTTYAVAGGAAGVAVYDFDAALALAEPCLDILGDTCPTVYQGKLDTDGRYVDVLETAGGVLMVTSAGVFSTLQLWLLNPQSPASSTLLFSGELHAQGTQLFELGGHVYLAWISEALGLNNERLKISLIDSCVGAGPCVPVEALLPLEVGPFPTASDFLTFSQAGGRSYLYYSAGTGNLDGPDLEQLFDVSALEPAALPLADLPEVTETGFSYVDPCNGSEIRYWSHYYHSNARGLNNFAPRSGKLSPEGFFYRASSSVLDVHFLTVPPPPEIFTDGFESGDTSKWQ